ncbi:MAG: hypothetical protein J3Q66DRAFT_340733 [Benniella sp.]|nr:MAG: hypothetical protein J3Q66DRAFT_340733 [Benniella sp.]
MDEANCQAQKIGLLDDGWIKVVKSLWDSVMFVVFCFFTVSFPPTVVVSLRTSLGGCLAFFAFAFLVVPVPLPLPLPSPYFLQTDVSSECFGEGRGFSPDIPTR